MKNRFLLFFISVSSLAFSQNNIEKITIVEMTGKTKEAHIYDCYSRVNHGKTDAEAREIATQMSTDTCYREAYEKKITKKFRKLDIDIEWITTNDISNIEIVPSYYIMVTYKPIQKEYSWMIEPVYTLYNAQGKQLISNTYKKFFKEISKYEP